MQAAPDGGGPQGAFPTALPHLTPGFMPPALGNPPGLPPQMYNLPPPGFGMPGYVGPEVNSIATNGDPVSQLK